MPSDPLLQPYRLKHLTLKNRLMTTAHEPNFGEVGMPKDRYRRYHVERAKGGLALTMTAGSAVVSADSLPAFGNLLAYKDEIVPWLSKLADEVHEHGCAVMIQLTHLGRRTYWHQADWLPVIAASPLREPAHRAFPKEMEDWDIERVIRDYADAAERMQPAGLDGFELECYGHLIDGFWSPATGRRTDEYGGTLENRMRFGMRVLEAIRARVGPDMLVGLRIAADENWELGLSRAEGVEICRRFRDSGLIDSLNIIRGHVEHDAAATDVIPVTGMASAPHLDCAGEVRGETGFPTFHASRIADVATARHAIAEGKLDMVGMTRAHIAEAHIVRKIVEGSEHRIRPCVGATYCLDRIYAELAVSSWDILSGDVKPGAEVLVLDDNGSHPGVVATEFIAAKGVPVEFLTPERTFAPDVGGLNVVHYARNFQKMGVRITTMTGISRLERAGNRVRATLWSPFTMAECGERIVDQVVVENGTAPLDDLYFALKEGSVNRGEVDYPALRAGRPQELFRIGDAIASRNIHAAVYDGLRFAKDF